jgi:hypothetical protein
MAAAMSGQSPEMAGVPVPREVAARLSPLLFPGTKIDMLPGALEATRRVERDDARLAPEFGATDFSSTTISGTEFQPVLDATIRIYSDAVEITSGAPLSAIAALHLDTGVRWDGVLWWAFDGSAQTLTLDLVQVCWPFAPGPPTTTLLASGATSGASGHQFFFTGIPSPVTVQNSLCSYHYLLTATGTDPGNLAFRRGRAGWFRQVSPAPMTATFPNDVPTTHPFFRFIEALAASGITAGCDAGSFCPDDPVTRGQMAVFLVAALGLHFPF